MKIYKRIQSGADVKTVSIAWTGHSQRMNDQEVLKKCSKKTREKMTQRKAQDKMGVTRSG